MYEKKGIFWQNKLTETEVGIMSQFQQQTVNFNSGAPRARSARRAEHHG